MTYYFIIYFKIVEHLSVQICTYFIHILTGVFIISHLVTRLSVYTRLYIIWLLHLPFF